MAYKRSYATKYGAYAKKSRTRTGAAGRDMPLTAAAVKRMVRKMVPAPEMKRAIFQANEIQQNTLSSNVSWTELSVIGQGATPAYRLGNEIIAKRVEYSGVLHNNDVSKASWARILLLQYGAEVDITNAEVFDNVSGGLPGDTVSTFGLDCIYQPINTNKFKVLSDKIHKLSGSNSTDGGHTKFIRGAAALNKKIQFDATTVGENNQTVRYALVTFIATADDDTAGTVIEVNWQAKFSFIDNE